MDDHAGHRARLRQRFQAAGGQGLGTHEVLELLLTYAIPRRDVKPIAYALLRRFGSLHGVLEASREDLCQVEGIGPSAAALILLMLPLYRAYQSSQMEQKRDLSDPEALRDYCRALLLGERYERLYVLALDGKGKLLGNTLISTGDEGETAVYPRLILAALLRQGAQEAVLCHNHPGGEAQASTADLQMTKALQELLQPLQIRLRDHLIIAGDSCLSLRAQGRLHP